MDVVRRRLDEHHGDGRWTLLALAPGIAYDARARHVVLFCGYNGPFYNDTWQLH